MRHKAVLAATVAALVAVGPPASAVGGTETGYKYRSSCSTMAPQPWVLGTTRGDTYIKGPGRTTTLYYYNSNLQGRTVVGAYNGGYFSVQGVSEIDTIQTYGFCFD